MRPSTVWAGPALLAVLVLTPLRPWLEASLIGHMLVQIPLLVLAGALMARSLPEAWRIRAARLDAYGVLGLLLALFVVVYWLLPRNLDAAVLEAGAGWLKIVTLVLLAGMPLGLTAPLLPLLVRGVLWVKGTAMFFVMGWLYREAPDRLCNAYLLGEQLMLGNIMLGLGAISLAAILALLFFGPPNRHRQVVAGETLDQSQLSRAL
ncbi:putative transmembrane protein [Thioalkalivibrio sp. K90mix]|uniref:hypothetical protein n=1 Tax=unclassified Thioalkalivibrio TaxID=2621013 RepID=UPI000195A40E|nr:MULTISPECIES: hypothetical protein [unclassified Thioalkalivibrio]ADC70705.1 putative transmembrane protein [Thioalkalivibrio sp. K90mix]